MKSVFHRTETCGHADHGWLNTHDRFGIEDTANLSMTADTDAKFLLMEIPMAL